MGTESKPTKAEPAGETLDDWLEEWREQEGWRASKAEVQRLVDVLRELRRHIRALEMAEHMDFSVPQQGGVLVDEVTKTMATADFSATVTDASMLSTPTGSLSLPVPPGTRVLVTAAPDAQQRPDRSRDAGAAIGKAVPRSMPRTAQGTPTADVDHGECRINAPRRES